MILMLRLSLKYNVRFSLFLGSVEFTPDVTSSEKSVKVMLNSQDKVGVPWPAVGLYQLLSAGSPFLSCRVPGFR